MKSVTVLRMASISIGAILLFTQLLGGSFATVVDLIVCYLIQLLVKWS